MAEAGDVVTMVVRLCDGWGRWRQAAMMAIAARPVGVFLLSGIDLGLAGFFTTPCMPCSLLRTSMKSTCFFSLLGTDFSPRLPPEPAILSINAFRAGSNATSGGMLFGKTKLLGRELAPPLAGGGGGGGGGPPRFAPEICFHGL